MPAYQCDPQALKFYQKEKHTANVSEKCQNYFKQLHAQYNLVDIITRTAESVTEQAESRIGRSNALTRDVLLILDLSTLAHIESNFDRKTFLNHILLMILTNFEYKRCEYSTVENELEEFIKTNKIMEDLE